MLHNTGPFGPNDVPVNVSAQGNITDMSGQVNIGNSINNLSKIAQHSSHPVNSHFNLPDYTNYGLNMNTAMNSFHNFHHLGYQPNLMPQNAIQSSWQNSGIPMNLNAQTDQHSMLGYYDKKYESHNELSEQNYNKSMLNIPQVYTKALHKHLGMDPHHDYQQYNPNINNYNHYFDHNPDLCARSQKTETEGQMTTTKSSYIPHKIDKIPYYSEQIDLSNKRKDPTPIPQDMVCYPQATSVITKPAHTNLDKNLILNTEPQIETQKDDFSSVPSSVQLNNIDTNKNLDLSVKPQTSAPLKEYDRRQTEVKDSLDGRPLIDPELRRRNLANTVRMIEDILIQTTNSKKKELESMNQDTSDSELSKKSKKKRKNRKRKSESPPKDTERNISTEIDDDSTESTNPSNQSNDDVQSIISMEKTDIESETNTNLSENDSNKSNEGCVKVIKREFPSDNEMSDSKDTENEKIDELVVKIEISPDVMEVDHFNPFQRDCFGVQGEDANSEIHDAENSIAVAFDIVKNGQPAKDSYFECPHCSLYFDHPKRFLIHTKWHTFGLTNEKRMDLLKEKEFRKNLRREARVLERMQKNEITEVENVDGKKYNCNECDKVFCKKASLQNHKQRYHPTRPRECKICGKVLVGWLALRDHHLTHFSESGYFQCTDCPKQFKYSHSLAKHRDTHLEKTHGCQQCPKMFGSAALLNVHMKTHERVLRGATFRCTYCGKGFFESYHLQAHERTHRNERPYPCEICKTSFGTKSGLQRHLKVSHSSSKPYECSTCHRSFISEAIRDRHELRNHGNPEDFKFVCKQCPCRYMKLKDLRKHVYKVHPKGKRKKKSDSDSE